MTQYQLVYISDATKAMTIHELEDLLNKARKNNLAQGITGCLLYGHDKFIQMLEGPKAAVLALYEKISADKRHTNILSVQEMSVNEKLFDDWSMGFKLLDEGHQMPEGYEDCRKWIYSEFVADANRAKEKVFNFAAMNELMESQVLPR